SVVVMVVARASHLLPGGGEMGGSGRGRGRGPWKDAPRRPSGQVLAECSDHGLPIDDQRHGSSKVRVVEGRPYGVEEDAPYLVAEIEMDGDVRAGPQQSKLVRRRSAEDRSIEVPGGDLPEDVARIGVYAHVH